MRPYDAETIDRLPEVREAPGGMTMRFGAQLWSQTTTWPQFRDAALAAEAAGWDSRLDVGPPERDLRPVGAADLRGLVDPHRDGVGHEADPARADRRREHVPQPRADREARDDPRPRQRRAGDPRHRRRLVRAGARRVRLRDLGLGVRRAARPARRVGRAPAAAARRRADRRPRRAASTTLRDALCEPRPVQAHLPILDRRLRAEEDAPDDRRATPTLWNTSGATVRGGPGEPRRPRRALRRGRAATAPRSS